MAKFASSFDNAVRFGSYYLDLTVTIDKSMIGVTLYFIRKYYDVNNQLLELYCDEVEEINYGELTHFRANERPLIKAKSMEAYISDEAETPITGTGNRHTLAEPEQEETLARFATPFEIPVKYQQTAQQLNIFIDVSMLGTQLHFVRKYYDVNGQLIGAFSSPVDQSLYGTMVELEINDPQPDNAAKLEAYIGDEAVDNLPLPGTTIPPGPKPTTRPGTTRPFTTKAPTTTVRPTTQPATTIAVSTIPPTTAPPITSTVPPTTYPDGEGDPDPATTLPPPPTDEVTCDWLIEIVDPESGTKYQIPISQIKWILENAINCTTKAPTTAAPTTTIPVTTTTTAAPTTAGPTTTHPSGTTEPPTTPGPTTTAAPTTTLPVTTTYNPADYEYAGWLDTAICLQTEDWEEEGYIPTGQCMSADDYEAKGWPLTAQCMQEEQRFGWIGRPGSEFCETE